MNKHKHVKLPKCSSTNAVKNSVLRGILTARVS